MTTEIRNHRLGAFIYGFLCGGGLILIIWGLASIIMLPAGYLMTNVSLTLLGVMLFAAGSCREAYLRGNLSTAPKPFMPVQANQFESADLISEQLVENPAEPNSD